MWEKENGNRRVKKRGIIIVLGVPSHCVPTRCRESKEHTMEGAEYTVKTLVIAQVMVVVMVIIGQINVRNYDKPLIMMSLDRE